jgi:hypothetical protein
MPSTIKVLGTGIFCDEKYRGGESTLFRAMRFLRDGELNSEALLVSYRDEEAF